MGMATHFDDAPADSSEAQAARDASSLIAALVDMGWFGVSIERVDAGTYEGKWGRAYELDGGYCLCIDGIVIACGFHKDADLAMEELLDRSAALFYFDTPGL